MLLSFLPVTMLYRFIFTTLFLILVQFLIYLNFNMTRRSILFPYTTLFRSHSPSMPGPKPTHRVPNWSETCSMRSEEHTSELQSRGHLVCRLLLEINKIKNTLFGDVTNSENHTY